MEKKVVIAMATDERYVPYCGVALQSLISTRNPKRIYEAYIFYESLSKYSINRLHDLSVNDFEIKFINISPYADTSAIREYNHVTVASAYRLSLLAGMRFLFQRFCLNMKRCCGLIQI